MHNAVGSNIRNNHLEDNGLPHMEPSSTDSQSAVPMLTREPDGDHLLKLASESSAFKVGKEAPSDDRRSQSTVPLRVTCGR